MSVKKYRKKPVEIEAMRLTDENVGAVAEWCGGKAAPSPSHHTNGNHSHTSYSAQPSTRRKNKHGPATSYRWWGYFVARSSCVTQHRGVTFDVSVRHTHYRVAATTHTQPQEGNPP